MSGHSSTSPAAGYRRALCCQCGQLRLVKENYWRGRIGEPSKEAQAGPRCLLELKCDHCRAVTSHAYLRDADRYADYAEWSEQEYEQRLDALLRSKDRRTKHEQQ